MSAALWDWRRTVADLYAAVRANRDPQAAWASWRETRDRLFRDHPESPIEDRTGFRGLPCFPYDPALRFRARLVPASGPEVVIDTGADGVLRMAPFARTAGLGAALGGELTLHWIAGYGGGVFLPFRDATNDVKGGGETYGGGRYLLDTIKGADLGSAEGEAVLDFNFSYNPSCAYSARYVCPLAPPENRLPGAVRAGERTRT